MNARKMVKPSLIVAVALFTGWSTAGELSRLPKDLPLPVGEGSPGPVTFSHETHVDAEKPRCVTCHPVAFRILGSSSPQSERRITHEAMEKRAQSCGACHGKTAFGFDDCENCHKM